MRKNLFTRFILIGLSVTFFSFFVYPNPDNFKSINEKLDQFLLDTEFNGAILIAKNGKVVFKNAYGFGDIDHKVKLNPKSSFNLASLSKQFTAAGIMVLFEKNKLKLDDPVAKYLPQFSYVKEISIRHLLHHTSGLPCIYGILNSQWDKSKIAGNEVLLNVFAKQKPKLLFKPGEKMQYSNTGYIVLASIIEKVSGQPFFEFMEKNIFKPLKMNDSYAYYKTMKEYPRQERVWGLKKQEGKTVLNDLIFCDGMRGDGNVHSSIEDLFKWDQALYTEKLLKKKTLKMMFTPGRLNNGESFAYGFGWGVTDSGKKVHHGGGWVGFRSFMMRYLDKKDTIIVLCNCVPPIKGKTVEKINSWYNLQ